MVWQRLRNRLSAGQAEYNWLFTLICLAVLPHITRVPAWITVLFVLLALWKILFDNPSRKPRFTGQLVRLGIAGVIITGTFITYGTLTGRDAGIALLIMLTGMKFLETRRQRDFYITAYIGMFLLLTEFLYSQSILTAVYMFVVVVLFAGTLIAYNDHNGSQNTRERLRTAGAMLAQSLPLMLILFVLFPRLPGPIWGLPRDAHAGLTGIDDEMQPGSVSRLVHSDDIAFRVKFDGAVPKNSLLYWRGPVLVQTDGVKWFPDKPGPFTTRVTVAGQPIRYTVTLEPTDHDWLYALEMPSKAPPGSKLVNDLQIIMPHPIHNRMRYKLTSYTDYKIATDDASTLADALQLPAGYDPRAVALGKSWRAQGLNDRQIVNKALRMFHDQDFYYTTTPPPMLQDVVDQFLFQYRRGFCEHYAAAFTILMRAAGIPTRIVTGYQGGTVNPVDGYLVVRQRDAHAWTEVWLKGRGWTRIDPTAAVAPSRVLQGAESGSAADIYMPLGLQRYAAARTAWLRTRDTIDAINNRWNQWILSYDARQQRQLLGVIGMGDFSLRALGITLVLSVLVVFAAVYLWMFRRAPRHRDPARQLYDSFCNKLAKLGIRRRGYEGPIDFATRANRRRRDLAVDINHITQLYVDIRYGDKREYLLELKSLIREFKPARL